MQQYRTLLDLMHLEKQLFQHNLLRGVPGLGIKCTCFGEEGKRILHDHMLESHLSVHAAVGRYLAH